MQLLKKAVSLILLAVVVTILVLNYDLSDLSADAHHLSRVTIAMVCLALLGNGLAAALRFKTVAAYIEQPIRFRKAMAVVSVSSLAGALFFQLAGQLMARGVLMGRQGVTFAGVVVITAYERIVSALLSGLLALAGAYFIFGQVYLDQDAGGYQLVQILCGLFAATIGGALIAYGRSAARSVTPLLSQRFATRFLHVVILSLFVQLFMMVAYVVTAHNLSPDVPIASIIAATAVVMLAASVPISFAGWGVREMSAIVALGTVGVVAHAAFTTALIIGFGSLVAMGAIAAVSLPGSFRQNRQAIAANPAPSIDYSNALAWTISIASATLVLFQIYIPVGSGLLNVNLADPLALLAAALFILNAIKSGRAPQWRVQYINFAVVIATLALGGSLLIGAWRFGWTDWAWLNRFLGWFVLLAYGATGALILLRGGEEGLRIIFITYAAATASIAATEVVFVMLQEFGFNMHIVIGNVAAFSQNHNFFAFQLLMATSAAIVFARGNYLRIALLALLALGFWFAGSRSGWIALIFVIGTSLYLGSANGREIVLATACAALVAIVTATLPTISTQLPLSHVLSRQPARMAPSNSTTAPVSKLALPALVPDETDTHERMITIIGGVKLFLKYPVFGAGLGAFRNEHVLASSGIPLLIHSTALWLLAELGIVGFLVFSIPAVYVFVTEWRLAQKEKASAVAVLCCVAFAVMSTPADMLYQRTFWLLIGAALALAPVNFKGSSDLEGCSARAT